jgi:hypothetical protein
MDPAPIWVVELMAQIKDDHRDVVLYVDGKEISPSDIQCSYDMETDQVVVEVDASA